MDTPRVKSMVGLLWQDSVENYPAKWRFCTAS